MAKATAKAKPRTKSEILTEIANATELNKKQVAAVFESMAELIKKDLSKRGPGVFTIPGLVKVRVIDKPATKERQGINPFTKEPMTIKAKPARREVKVRALKGLKELV
jgi:nucleoid DNA-binding protein